MEEEEDLGRAWPEDMERRRIAALHKFQRKHPDFMLHFMPNKQFHEKGSRGEKCRPSSGSRISSALSSKKGRPNRTENRWCLATTLQLLEQMKTFVRANKLTCLGECMVKWKKIAVHLSNPCGLELSKLARSSMVRFDNLRRNYRAGKLALIEVEVQDSMIEYFKICALNQSPGSRKPSSIKIESTMELALRCRRSSPSPPRTLALKGKSCHQQTPVEGGELLLHGNHELMLSGDESIDCRDEDDDVLLPGRSTDLETQIRMLPPPAEKRTPSDEEEEAAGRSNCPRSQVARNRIRRTSAPGTHRAPVLLRGSSRRTLTYE